MKRYILTFFYVAICLNLLTQNTKSSYFTHPGMLHSSEDLDRIKMNVVQKNEPWSTAWIEFQKSKWLENSYQPSSLEIVGRGVGSVGQSNIQNDCMAAYYNALAWYISGDEKFGKKAANIINDWSYKLKEINGKDAVLCAGIYGYKFANAAEILRYSYKKWPEKDIDQCKKMLLDVFYPVIKDFAPFANGNWDAASVVSMMSIGVFCDNQEIFDRALIYYYTGSGNGSILNYVVNESGQSQESGRDQPHAHLGISFLALAAETAYHQGLDMYSAYNNRLLNAFEYASKYNLGNDDVPFEPTFDRTGKYNHTIISTKDRRKILTGSEMVYGHYQNRMGIEAPFTEKTALNARPETFSFDMPGSGTLLFALPPFNCQAEDETKIPARPVSPIAKGTNNSIILSWIPVLNADFYSIYRTNIKSGHRKMLATNLVDASFIDKKVKRTEIYSYAIRALNKIGESLYSFETNFCAGMPINWKNADLGSIEITGNSNFNGTTYRLEGSGTDIGGTDDQFQFAYLSLTGNGTLTARFVPQVASQFVKTGLMIRENLLANSKHASLLIMPKAGKDIEIPAWHSNLLVRKTDGDSAIMAAQNNVLAEPVVSWGRLVQPYWLRLLRNGKVITAHVSPDGIHWQKAGEVYMKMNKKVLIGLAVCSRLTKVSTVVNFDHVDLVEIKR